MRIAVLGAGPVGLAVTGDLWLRGHRVSVWSRSAETMEPFRTKPISLDGALVAEAFPSLVTTDIAQVLADAQLVLICVPASGHEEVARAASPFLMPEQVVVLVPGRTFGALSFWQALGCPAEETPSIAETQTTPFSSRRREGNKCQVFSRKNSIAIAALHKARRAHIEAALEQSGLNCYSFVESTLVTSMNSISPLMHCPTILLNVSLVEANAEWARKLRGPTRFYSEFITPSIAALIERMDAERMAIADALGLGEAAESIRRWGSRTYGMEGLTFYQALQTNLSYGPIESPNRLDHRYLTEDVPTGLVPWESLGRALGVPVPLTSLMIDLAEQLLERNFRSEGRSLEKLGFGDVRMLIRQLES